MQSCRTPSDCTCTDDDVAERQAAAMACPDDTIHDEVDLEAGIHHHSPPASRRKRSRGCWSSCCCRLACGVLFAAALLGALYLALDPKLPRYTVHAVEVTAFGMDDDLTARARFNASVRFENPNRAIGIVYEDGSDLSVWFRGYRLSRGALPAFYQGHGDAATVRVAMSEARLQGTGVVEAMRHVNGAAGGELPLVFRGKVPVRVKVGRLTTPRVTPEVRCDLVLDRLTTEGALGVKKMDCKLSVNLW